MLFNLKEAGREDVNERAAPRVKSVGPIEFITLENLNGYVPCHFYAYMSQNGLTLFSRDLSGNDNTTFTSSHFESFIHSPA